MQTLDGVGHARHGLMCAMDNEVYMLEESSVVVYGAKPHIIRSNPFQVSNLYALFQVNRPSLTNDESNSNTKVASGIIFFFVVDSTFRSRSEPRSGIFAKIRSWKF
jgi:hypothetical protein